MRTVYVKLTNKCNIACKHCYNSMCETETRMSRNNLRRILKYIEELAANHPLEPIEVALHGGEPLLYDLRLLQWFSAEVVMRGATISATTNLLYDLTEEHLKLFRLFWQENNVKLVVTSWDGGDVRFKNEQMLYKWMYNVALLQNKRFEVQPIVTLTRPVLEMNPRDLFNKMIGLHITTMNFERLTYTGRIEENKDLWVTNREVDKWLGEAYRINETEYQLQIPLFKELESGYVGFNEGCKLRKCTETVTTFNPDGTVARCPNQPLDIIGRIDNDGKIVATEQEQQTQDSLTQKEKMPKHDCYKCEYYKECHGECFQLQWDESGCPGLIEVIKNVRKAYEGTLEYD